MAKRVLEVELSASGLEKAARWLENYADHILPKNVKGLVDRMCRTGEQYAINEVGHIDTGETVSSIMGYRNGDTGVIVAGGNAIWIEFGTGVAHNAGADSVHTNRAELGISDWGTYVWHGNISGLPHGDNPNGWWYKGDDGNYHHTYGMPMTPFMYNTAKMLKENAPKWAKEIFSK